MAGAESAPLDADVERETGAVFVGEAEDSVVGYVTTSTDAASGIGQIHNLAVKAGFRGMGIGRRLIRPCARQLQG